MGLIEKDIITNVYNFIEQEIYNDEELSDIIDDVYPISVNDENADFPYIVYKLDIDGSNRYISNATLTMDSWDFADTSYKLNVIRDNLIRLFSERFILIDNAVDIRLFYQTGSEIPEDTENVWHRSDLFVVRFDREVELTKILRRSD